MWADALRIAKEYAPHKLDQLQNEYDRESNRDDKYVLIILVWTKFLPRV